jgi:hypothetical protein
MLKNCYVSHPHGQDIYGMHPSIYKDLASGFYNR